MKYDLEELMKENMNIQETPSQELKERILYQEKGELTMRDKRKLMKFVPKVAAAAMAVVLATSGIVYAGTSLWNHYVAEDFGVAENDTLKKDLNEKGFAQQPQVTEKKKNQVFVTDQDITVSVQQTLADEHAAYVCFEIKYGDQYHVVDEGATENSDFGVAVPEWVDFQMDSGMDLDYCGGLSKIIDDHTILYDYFLTTSTMNGKNTFKDGRIKMNISAFTMDKKKMDKKPKVIAKDGKWDLAWDLSIGTEKRVYHLDQTLTLGKDRVVLKDLTISPLSGKLTIENPDGVSISEIGAVIKDTGGDDVVLDENGNLKIIRYVRTGGMEHEDEIREKLPEGQMLCSLDTYALCMDGKDFDGMGGISFGDGDYLFAQFDKVLDMEKVTGIRVAGQYIDLTSVSYETVQ